jgi:hypothetical protein
LGCGQNRLASSVDAQQPRARPRPTPACLQQHTMCPTACVHTCTHAGTARARSVSSVFSYTCDCPCVSSSQKQAVTPQLLKQVLREATLKQRVVPFICHHKKQPLMLQPLVDYLPSPSDLEAVQVSSSGDELWVLCYMHVSVQTTVGACLVVVVCRVCTADTTRPACQASSHQLLCGHTKFEHASCRSVHHACMRKHVVLHLPATMAGWLQILLQLQLKSAAGNSNKDPKPAEPQ